MTEDLIPANEPTQLSPEVMQQLGKSSTALASIRNNTIDRVQEQYDCTREEARSIVKFAHREEESDQLAYAPSSTEYLESRIDTGIRDELNRLLEEKVEYERIVARANDADSDPTQKFKRAAGASLTVAEAKERLALNFSSLLNIKKVLVSSRPAKSEGGSNIEINLGSIVSDIINNIKGEEQ